MAKSKRRNLKLKRSTRRRRNQKMRGGDANEEKPKETSMFGTLFGSSEAKPEETTPAADKKEEVSAVPPATEEPAVVPEKTEEPPIAEVKQVEEPPTSIFGTVFGTATPEAPPAAAEEQPVAAVVAAPDSNRVTKRKRKKRKTSKNGVPRCTAYCRMQAKKRFCDKAPPTPYYQ